MKERRRDRYGRLEPWMPRAKPHLFKLSDGITWFCSALNEEGLVRGGHGSTAVAAYNALKTYLALEYFKR